MKKNEWLRRVGRLMISVVLPLCIFGCAFSGCGSEDEMVIHVSGSEETESASVETSVSPESSLREESRENGREEETVASQSSDAAVNGSSMEVSGKSDAGASSGTGVMYVYVCGAVHVPGVYELPAGSRIYEAIAAAGGPTEEADDKSLNQAMVLTDGQQVTVYTKDEARELGLDAQNAAPVGQASDASGNLSGNVGTAGEKAGTESNTSGKVNLNTATKEELMTLPGIGEVRAAAIIQYREEKGSFSTIEDIKNIDGIKDKAFNKIKDYIEV